MIVKGSRAGQRLFGCTESAGFGNRALARTAAEHGRTGRCSSVLELACTRALRLATLLLALLLPFAQPTGRAAAQTTGPLTVTVDREDVSTDDVLLLEIVVDVDSGTTPAPILPSFEDFALMSSSTSSQLNIVGGQARSRVTYRYELQPLRFGMLAIEPVRLEWEGTTYTSSAIPIRVTPGRTPTVDQQATPGTGPAQGDPQSRPPTQGGALGRAYFVEAVVDVAEPWVGQQVVYSFRFYQSRRLQRRATYGPPEFTGLYRKEADDQRRYATSVGGQSYEVIELRTFLFPTAAGEVEIEPATLDLAGTILRTEAVTLNVKPLPPDAPEAFDGAVGQYQLTAAVDKTSTQVDQPIRLEVTVSGQGNLDTLPDPTWPEIEGWLSYDEGSTTNTRTTATSLVGERRWQRLLIPQRAGTVTMPAIELPFFEPVAGTYQVAAGQPVSLYAAPLAGAAPDESAAQPVATDIPAAPAAEAGVEPSPFPEGPRRLRPIEDAEAAALLADRSPRLWPWMLLLLPIALIGADIGRRRAGALQRARIAADRVGPVRAQVASHIAAGRSGSVAAPAAAGKALDAALSLAIGRPTAGLTRARLGEALAEVGEGSTSPSRTTDARSAGAHSTGVGSTVAQSTAAGTTLVARTMALHGDIDGFRFAGNAADQAAAGAADEALLDAAAALAEEWLRRVEEHDRAAAIVGATASGTTGDAAVAPTEDDQEGGT